MAGPAQLLGLALNGEIEQQGPQLLHLGAANDHAIEPVPTGEPLLLQTPFAAEQQVVLFQLKVLLGQPALQGRRQAETGFDPAALLALAQQPGARRPLGAPQQGIEGIEQNRLARTGFPGEHREAPAESELQALNQGNVFKAQTRQHSGPRQSGRP